MKTGAALRALGGAPHCGDRSAYWANGAKMTVCIVDGLGHGEGAAKAADAAVNYVGAHVDEPLQDIFAGCNRAITDTRGVAMAIAVVDTDQQQLTYAGIGNTRGQIYGKQKKLLRSDYGIVGGGFRKLSPGCPAYSPGDIIVLWTDGIPESIDLSGYGHDMLDDPQLLADQIIEDYALGTDDAGVLVFRDWAEK